MSVYLKKRDELLKEAGAVLVRNGKHKVWRLANGRIVSLSVSPSDRRAIFNQIKYLKRSMVL